jgi:predicted nucleic acid-binding protein
MSQTKILLDSNAYFRLARNIHPLLDKEFGRTARYCLYVTDAFEKEFQRSKRLRGKFHWVNQQEFKENRSRYPQISSIQRKEIRETFDHLRNHARTENLGTSPVDIQILAMAWVLNIQAVTDDGDMLQLADDFDIPTLTTLELMKLMLDEGHIEMDTVRRVAANWRYDKDEPRNFSKDYRRLFSEPPLQA